MHAKSVSVNESPPSERGPRDVIILGAGVVGMATAYALARRGMAVTIVDRAPAAGMGASFANGAQLSYVYTEALASPALVRHMPALLFGLDPAFRLHPSIDPDQIGWLLRFLRNATGTRFTAHTLAGLELGLESRKAMHALLERHPLPFHHRQTGKMHVYQDANAFAAAAKMVEIKRQHGAVQSMVSETEARDMEPALAARPERFAGAIVSPQEEIGDPHLFCASLCDILVRDYAVQCRFGATVKAVRHDGDAAQLTFDNGDMLSADHLVVCAGIAASQLIKPLAIRSPLLGMKGYSFNAPPGHAAPVHSITDVARKLVFCQLGDSIRVAGLAELGRRDSEIVPARLAALKASAKASLPEAADYERASSGWAGIRPMSPSSLPDIRTVNRRLSINIGHGMLGWTFAMGSAERVADSILRGGEA